MPRAFLEFMQGDNIYTCKRCQSHLSNLSQLISKAFRGQYGTAYLFNQVMNIRQGRVEEKRLTTGVHRVCDIYCRSCNDRKAIGWKYILAMELDQKYKQGKFILEQACIAKQNWTDQ